MSNTEQENINFSYQQEIDIFKKSINTLKRRINAYSLSRLLVFIGALASLFFIINYSGWVIMGFMLMLLLVFLILVSKQAKLAIKLSHQQHCATLLQNEIDILNGEINIYGNGKTFSDGQHPYTSDLDIFGEKSLFAYINRTSTLGGINCLAKWLQHPEEVATIPERAKALKELNTSQDENLNFRASLFSLKADDLQNLKNNLQNHIPNAIQFVMSKKANFIIWFLPLLTFAILAAALIFNGILWSVFSLQLVLNFVAYNFYIRQINAAHQSLAKTGHTLQTLAKLIKNLELKSWQTPYLQKIIKALENPKGEQTHLQINQLAKIATNFDYRNNVLVGTVLNIFFCWDLRVIKALYKWNAACLPTVLNSFDVVYHIEALLSLATLNYNHPHWAQPEISMDFCLNTVDMAHPLIADDKKVSNNFWLAENPTTDIITGSNMAGKSTFLRTVGINMILAFAGANVCARSFHTSVFNVVSYMRIIDSLTAETSTFKAEIDRLKMILTLTQTNKNTLVLIDEMLRGTNSKDKYEGSKALIEKLILQQTPTLFATHDLQIAELEKTHPTQVRNFHFDVKIEGDKMFFDYKIKQGECKTFNAAVLLRAIGLA